MEEACQRMKDISPSASDSEKVAATEQCLLEVMTKNMSDLMKDYNVSMDSFMQSPTEMGYKIGERFGARLVGYYPEFGHMALLIASYKQLHLNMPLPSSTSLDRSDEAKLLQVETDEFETFTLVNSKKQQLKLIWLHEIKAPSDFLEHPEQYKGKKLKVSYKHVRLYSAKSQVYKDYDELVSIEIPED
jgi:hypothetical protein